MLPGAGFRRQREGFALVPRRRGTVRSLNEALAATLARVADVMTAAGEPWWVIAGAAAALHGCGGEVGDVDVLIGVGDVARLFATLGIGTEPPGISELFRSHHFGCWQTPPLTVEFMAGFAVRTGATWRPVAPRTRERVAIGSGEVFVPARAELAALLRLFGRPKDLARAAALEG